MVCFVLAGHVVTDELENGLAQPLLLSSENKQNEDDDHDIDESEEASEDSRKSATSLRSAYRLLTPSVKVCNVTFKYFSNPLSFLFLTDLFTY